MAKRIVKMLTWAVLVGILLFSSGCHTLSGVGKDLQDATDKYTEREK